MGVHGLDTTICSKELEHLPTELLVYPPTKCAIYELGDGYYYWYDDGEHSDGYMGYSWCIWWKC